MSFPSYILGPFFMVLGFFLCALIVVGTKSVIIFIKEVIKQKLSPAKTRNIKEKTIVRKKVKPQKVNSISLNTDDIDRIYFRKSS